MRARRGFVAVAMGVFALVACSPAEAPGEGTVAPGGTGRASYARDMDAKERADCTADGGTVQRRGMLGMEMCVHAYADAGRTCTDSAQCQGRCVGPAGGEGSAGAAVSGQCQADDRLFGCYSEVKGGSAAYAICVD